jgi:hypothetical protein
MPVPSGIEIRPLCEAADVAAFLTPDAMQIHGRTRESPRVKDGK